MAQGTIWKNLRCLNYSRIKMHLIALVSSVKNADRVGGVKVSLHFCKKALQM